MLWLKSLSEIHVIWITNARGFNFACLTKISMMEIAFPASNLPRQHSCLLNLLSDRQIHCQYFDNIESNQGACISAIDSWHFQCQSDEAADKRSEGLVGMGDFVPSHPQLQKYRSTQHEIIENCHNSIDSHMVCYVDKTSFVFKKHNCVFN